MHWAQGAVIAANGGRILGGHEQTETTTRCRSKYNNFELRLQADNGTITKVMRPNSRQAHREVGARRRLAQPGSVLAPELLDVVVRGDDLDVVARYVVRDREHIADADPTVLRDLLQQLGHVHASTFEPPDTLADRKAKHRAEAALVTLFELTGLAPKSTAAGTWRKELTSSENRIALTHRDLTDDNIIVAHDRAWVIDWEVSTCDFFLMDIARLPLSFSSEQRIWAVEFYVSCFEPRINVTQREIELAELVFLGQMLQ